MRNRKDILTDLFFLRGNLTDLKTELSKYPWDMKVPIWIISKQEFTSVLYRYIENEMGIEELERWANFIECRDDLGFEVEDMREIIFELANPEINGIITKERIQEVINELLKER